MTPVRLRRILPARLELATPRSVGCGHGSGNRRTTPIVDQAVSRLVLKEAINLGPYNFFRRSSTYGRFTRFGFPVTEIDFPSPTALLKHLDDGVFHSFVLHITRPPPKSAGERLGEISASVCAQVYTTEIVPLIFTNWPLAEASD